MFRKFPTLLLLLSGFFLQPGDAAAKGADAPLLELAAESGLPSQYGRVIYQRSPEASRQLYIIGQSHRSALSGKNGIDTVQVQSEIYRIGEWLKERRQVELLLPEGYFSRNVSRSPGSRSGLENVEAGELDDATLAQKLGETERYVSADMLLQRHCRLKLAQVEERPLYLQVRRLLEEQGSSMLEALEAAQKQRTLTLLENAPRAIDGAYECGDIDSRRAIFTIGLTHLADILRLLETAGEGAGLDDYGVTVILPSTLAANQPLLARTGLLGD